MLNGLLVVLLATLWQESRHPVLPVIGLVALLKIIFETTNQTAIFTHLSWAGLPGAHGAGMATGLAYLVMAAVYGRGCALKTGSGTNIPPGIVDAPAPKQNDGQTYTTKQPFLPSLSSSFAFLIKTL